MEHDEDISNNSGNRSFGEVLGVSASRRKFMRGSLAAAAGSFIAPSIASAQADFDSDDQTWDDDELEISAFEQRSSAIEFTPVPTGEASGPIPNISEEYEYQVIIPWGTPLEEGVMEYDGDPNTRPTSEEQAAMVGIGHDGMHFFPKQGNAGNRRGLLVINHEFGRNTHVLAPDQLQEVAGDILPNSLEAVRLSQHAHGVSVVDMRKRRGGVWEVITRSRLNRRIHVNTPVTFSGPVAGSALLESGGPALGTVNNCSNGYTPWGTYLTCEENFNGYFGDSTYDRETESGSWTPTAEQERYGFSPVGFSYGWELFDPRFDLSIPETEQEANRFGWVVEIDPNNPRSAPVKRTALGRFKHEGATLTIGAGNRAVVYMGDDQRFDYIYKFVSADNWQTMVSNGISPLDEGTLYVARFDEDGTGQWLEMSIDDPAIQAAGLSSQEEVLTYARVAADALGATPMDRPEWISVAPNQDVFCTLTNNSRRGTEDNLGADAANPLAPNNDGHIIRWRDAGNHVGTTFEWSIFVIAEDTHAEGDERTFSDPDGLWIDPNGRMFIQTDGGQQKEMNNQMLVVSVNDDPDNLDIRRMFTGVSGDEITGLTTTPNRRFMFINTQHPGNGDPSLTNFPAQQDGVTIPRDCTMIIKRKDKGIVGS
ncbi:MAG: PhoX family phosphatase [Pseudomonadota bacterium]